MGLGFALEAPWRKNWPSGVPFNIKYPEIAVYDLLENSAKKYPNRTALIFYGRRLSYTEVELLARRAASALVDTGVGKGDRVALILPNIPQFIIAYYAALMTGATVVPINPLCDSAEIGRQVIQCKARTLISLDVFLDKVAEAGLDPSDRVVIATKAETYLPFPAKILRRGSRRKSSTSHMNLERMLREHEPATDLATVDAREDIAVIQYTGGTTGSPKGAMLTHYSLVANVIQTYHWLRGWGHARKPQFHGHPVVLGAVPFFHIYGMTVAMNEAIHSASTLVLLVKPEAGSMIQSISRHDVTHFPATPTMFRTILSHPSFDKLRSSQLGYCVSGGDPISSKAVDEFSDSIHADFFVGYGLTEASPVTHCTVAGYPVPEGCVGIPFPDTQAKIMDIQTGEREMPPGTLGELIVKGPQIMKGYIQDAQNDVALRNGWLYTGDVGYMDETGLFYIVDRKQDRILSKGHTVWPRGIEEVLMNHPSVEAAAVVGIDDPQRCAVEVRAYVVPKPGHRLQPDELSRFCSKALENYQIPEVFEIVDNLPTTPLGKISRSSARSWKKGQI